ncbi:MAG: molybdopterin-dependent oxidoreductase [Negativicutes bacterium]|nr:molybdopterin-dependent oxidoreductase [Negativicutes bacterium]
MPENKRLLSNFGRVAHLALGLAVVWLAVSGLMNYLPVLRGPTAGIHWFLVQGHIAVGLALPVILVVNIPFFLNETVLARVAASDWTAVLVLVAVVCQAATGLALYFSMAPSYAGLVHIFIALFFLPLLGRHVYLVLKPTNSAEAVEEPGAGLSGRRAFLAKTGGLILVLAGWAGIEWIKDVLAARKVENLAMFEDCNQLNPVIGPQGPGASYPGYQGQFKPYTVTKIPCATTEAWQFLVEGLVERPLAYHWPEFAALPRTVQLSDFHCVEGWSVTKITYEGIPLRALLASAGVRPEAGYVEFISGDGLYTDTLTLEQAAVEDVMVALLIDGKPIPSALGGPARLVVPQMYAYKSVKWLIAIRLIDKPKAGYWEERGYPADATIKGPKNG